MTLGHARLSEVSSRTLHYVNIHSVESFQKIPLQVPT